MNSGMKGIAEWGKR